MALAAVRWPAALELPHFRGFPVKVDGGVEKTVAMSYFDSRSVVGEACRC